MAGFSEAFKKFTDTKDTTREYNRRDISDNQLMAILAYFSWLVLIPLFAARKSPFARFHVGQGLPLAIAEIMTWIVFGILSQLALIGWIFSVVEAVITLGWVILAIIGIYNAANGKAKELPILGSFRILK